MCWREAYRWSVPPSQYSPQLGLFRATVTGYAPLSAFIISKTHISSATACRSRSETANLCTLIAFRWKSHWWPGRKFYNAVSSGMIISKCTIMENDVEWISASKSTKIRRHCLFPQVFGSCLFRLNFSSRLNSTNITLSWGIKQFLMKNYNSLLTTLVLIICWLSLNFPASWSYIYIHTERKCFGLADMLEGWIELKG